MENMKYITMKQACVIEFDSRFVQLAVRSQSWKENNDLLLLVHVSASLHHIHVVMCSNEM